MFHYYNNKNITLQYSYKHSESYWLFQGIIDNFVCNWLYNLVYATTTLENKLRDNKQTQEEQYLTARGRRFVLGRSYVECGVQEVVDVVGEPFQGAEGTRTWSVTLISRAVDVRHA